MAHPVKPVKFIKSGKLINLEKRRRSLQLYLARVGVVESYS